MARIYDFVRRLYRQRQYSDDPVRRRFYQIAEMARTDPTVSAARQIFAEEVGVDGQTFDEFFASYWMSMKGNDELNGKNRDRDWNIEDEALMKSVGLSDAAIIAARTDFTTAVLNRVFLRVAMDGMAKRVGAKHQAPTFTRVEPPPLRAAPPTAADTRNIEDGNPAAAPANRLLEAVEGALKAMADEAVRKRSKEEVLLRLLRGKMPPLGG